MKMSAAEAKKISLNSTRACVAPAEAAAETDPLNKLEFVSTLGVAGRLRGVVSEVQDVEPREFKTTYESSNADAERLVFENIAAGLPITVHRPRTIVGDLRDRSARHFQISYYILEFLSGRYTGGILPDSGDVQLDSIPVDFIAAALKQSRFSEATRAQILQLCSGHEWSLTLKDIAGLVAERFPASRKAKHTRRVPWWALPSSSKRSI